MRPSLKIRTEISKRLQSIFWVAFSFSNPQRPEKLYTSAVATPATQTAPVLTAVFEIPRCAIHCYCPTMATILHMYF